MAGFYGKLPTKGDFLHRNLPRDFVDCWDDWLQSGMQESRQSLGDDWLQTYLTSPLWRYILAPGVCGSEARAGVLMPSMDRVGRYFPMTVAVSLPAPLSPLTVATSGRSWFESVEACLLEALDDEALDLDAFDERLQAIALQSTPAGVADVASALGQGLRADLDDTLDIPAALFPVTAAALDSSLQDCSLWWGHGSEQVAPSLVFCRGLPAAGRFTALLDGNWAGHGWQDGAGTPVNYPEPCGEAAGG